MPITHTSLLFQWLNANNFQSDDNFGLDFTINEDRLENFHFDPLPEDDDVLKKFDLDSFLKHDDVFENFDFDSFLTTE
jgi:hypothetical protein